MKRVTKRKIKEGGIVALAVIGLIILLYGLSWIVTCGIIKLITLCFGLAFKWSIATGIWLALVLIRAFFKSNSKTEGR